MVLSKLIVYLLQDGRTNEILTLRQQYVNETYLGLFGAKILTLGPKISE